MSSRIKILLGSIAALVILVGIALAIPNNNQSDLEHVVMSDATAPATSEEVVQETSVVPIVEIYNPFGSEDDISITYSVEGAGNSVNGLSSKTQYNVDSPQMTLPAPNEFEKVGIERASMNDDGTLIIVHEYMFYTDSLITWENGSSIDTTNRWENQAASMPISRGQKVTVTYTSKDGGNGWIGKVII